MPVADLNIDLKSDELSTLIMQAITPNVDEWMTWDNVNELYEKQKNLAKAIETFMEAALDPIDPTWDNSAEKIEHIMKDIIEFAKKGVKK